MVFRARNTTASSRFLSGVPLSLPNPNSRQTLGDAYRELTRRLMAAGVENASTDARLLVCAAVGAAPTRLISAPESILTEEEARTLEAWSRRRVAREPVTRIIGRRGFWSFDLEVHPDVLDPRPDSERLIEVCLARFAGMGARPARLMDIGCGSGALIAALLLEYPDATGVALDLSPAACAATTANLAAIGVGDRCDVRLKDWREEDERGFDLVISNPPYIPSSVIETLDPEVRNYDPALALDGGLDGLSAYRSLCDLAPAWLRPGGIAAVEIGYDQGEEVVKLLGRPEFVDVELARDIAGNPRVVSAKRI